MFPSLFLLTCLFLPTAYSAFYAVSIQYHENGDLKEPQPLVLTENGTSFFYPSKKVVSSLESPNGFVRLACPGNDNYIQVVPNPKEATVTCIRDTIFSVDRIPRTLSSLACRTSLQITVRSLQKLCLNRYHSMEIGFQLDDRFLQTIELCRNDNTYETYYTKFNMSNKHGSVQTGYPRLRNWRDAKYFAGLNMERLYNWRIQVKIIGQILQSEEIAKQYINQGQFLSRGHMSAKSDFIYGSQQNTTFSYLNAAPQWVSFNGGNWMSLEVSVQNFTRRSSRDIEVYTGVHGQMTMADKNGQQQKIQLTEPGTKKTLIVPKFFWKIIYDPVSKKGTAFVGLNDPFIPSISGSIYLCKDRIESKIDWINWMPTNIKKGVSYVCPINSLRKEIPTIPPLNVIGDLISPPV
ncbi:salivary endonuclease-like [Colletes latitarsis]|uniref:salivary endonuclease-like n=1 Tax=Colletes latitarsis TaxID=2605962 RepID=UPI0040373527